MAKSGRDKLDRYHLMKNDEKLAPHLPETDDMTPSAFWELLGKHGVVIVKPNEGRRGQGVIKVTRLENGGYELHHENQIQTVSSRELVTAYLLEKMGFQRYLVQQRIPLVEIDGRMIDFRVIVQRKQTTDPWEVTAKVVKHAGDGYIVSNIARSGGNILFVEDAVEKSSLKQFGVETLSAEIDRVVILASERMCDYFPDHRIYGYDIGVDSNGHVWIIEVNRWPMMSHFRKLEDKTFYKRIKEYKKG